MIVPSTTISHAYAVPSGGKGLVYSIPLKSSSSGDDASINTFQFRALIMSGGTGTEVLSSSGGVDVGTSTVTIVPKDRPPLMHQHGVKIETGTTGVDFYESTSQSPVGTAYFLIKPTSGTVRLSRGALNVDIVASTGVVTYSGAQSVYVNGALVTTGTTVPFPYPRLVTVAYTAATEEPITIKASTGTCAAYVQQVGVTGNVMTATDVSNHSILYYRKPNVTSVLTDPSGISGIVDNPVTVKTTWIEF